MTSRPGLAFSTLGPLPLPGAQPQPLCCKSPRDVGCPFSLPWSWAPCSLCICCIHVNSATESLVWRSMWCFALTELSIHFLFSESTTDLEAAASSKYWIFQIKVQTHKCPIMTFQISQNTFILITCEQCGPKIDMKSRKKREKALILRCPLQCATLGLPLDPSYSLYSWFHPGYCHFHFYLCLSMAVLLMASHRQRLKGLISISSFVSAHLGQSLLQESDRLS